MMLISEVFILPRSVASPLSFMITLIFPLGSYAKLLSIFIAPCPGKLSGKPSKSSQAHSDVSRPALYSSHHDWAQAMADAFIRLFSAVREAMENI